MKNVISDLVAKIQVSMETLEVLEDTYKNKRKGYIYQNTRLHHAKKIKALLIKLDSIGVGEFTTYDFQYNNPDENPQIEKWGEITIDSQITEDEIRSRLLLSGMNVTYIKPQKRHIITGFPRITMKT